MKIKFTQKHIYSHTYNITRHTIECNNIEPRKKEDNFISEEKKHVERDEKRRRRRD